MEILKTKIIERIIKKIENDESSIDVTEIMLLKIILDSEKM